MPDYCSSPQSSTAGGILVLHAWWGLNDFQRTLSDRLAAEGFAVMVPDLCDGAVARTLSDAKKLRRTIMRPATSRHILQALRRLRSRVAPGRVGILGFSVGAYWGLWLAEALPRSVAATILFYSTRTGRYGCSQSAFMGHFAEQDEYVSESGRQRLERSLRTSGKFVQFFVYPETRHWFFEAGRPEYDHQAAALAWSRSVVEFHQKIG